MGSFAIAWPGDSAEHVCRKRNTCSVGAEIAVIVKMTTQLAHGGHCEQDFRWYWCRKTPLTGARRLAQTLLHPENSSETFGVRLTLWFKIASDNRILKLNMTCRGKVR